MDKSKNTVAIKIIIIIILILFIFLVFIMLGLSDACANVIAMGRYYCFKNVSNDL
jgi:uncharacterized protein YqfA (UPF0365 family)